MLEYYIVTELKDRLRATKQELVSEFSQKYEASEIEQSLAYLLEAKTISSWSQGSTIYYSA